ncbi:MAG: PAAR domain-containing protein [Pseudomonadota bacterium]
MGQPAARAGDMTVHGGIIVTGLPTVLIGLKPAARVADFHVCPLFTGLIPHVGGPILPPGSTTALWGSLPAARVGDRALCLGPLDAIAQGDASVLVGP